MGPFNIKVGFGKNEVALTILPAEGHYVVLYFDSIVGAIRQEEEDGESWEQVPDEDIVAGDLPRYQPDLNAERLNFVLCEHTVNNIGEEIIATLRDEIS